MNMHQQQTIYDLNSLLNDNYSSSGLYGFDNFDLSLLGSEYPLENVQLNNNSAFKTALSIEIDANIPCTYPFTQLKQEEHHEWNNQQYYLQSSLMSPISPATIQSSPSPCPSIEYKPIKQEYSMVLPPSPPDSNGVPSPQSNHCDSVKVEQQDDSYQHSVLSPSEGENFIDINYLLEREYKEQDHQVLRGFLQDTSFQRKHNLKPLPLENLFGGLTQREDIEPVISLALQHAKQEVQATCNILNISPNPCDWTNQQVQLWINLTIKQFKLDFIEKCETIFTENGQQFALLSDEEFIRRAPQIGGTLHAQLEIWKATFIDADSSNSPTSTALSTSAAQASNTVLSQTSIWNQMLSKDSNDNMNEDDHEEDDDADEDESDVEMVSQQTPESVAIETNDKVTATKTTYKKVPKKHPSHLQKKGGAQSSHIHLWQFLKELLASPQTHGTAIRWLDRSKGIFKIEDSVRVARLWGRRKNRPAMNYDKLSRSIRQYYKKGIMKKTERSQRLVYQFCHPYSL